MATKPKTKEAPVADSKALTETLKATVPAAFMDDVMADAGAGLEHVTTADQMIPFLRILQSNSPQAIKRNAAYVESAEPSMLINTATTRVYDGEKGCLVIPCTYQRRYTEWWPRDDDAKGAETGKGLVRDWGQDDSILAKTTKDKRNRDVTAQGTYISTDGTFYCLLVDEETGAHERVVVTMTSTQLKKSRRWNTIMSSFQIPRPDGRGTFTPPIFYRSYRLTTVPEGNDNGDWFGWAVAPGPLVPELPAGADLYNAAKAFREAVNAGLVKAAPAAREDGADAETGEVF